ncbi:MAG: RHS repeat-associated core domain-containing protein [Cyclobacteriaceae bacterium]|nr:RHS repeat-associated core domain-containing protein [Cyclobacteriaceae bacterium]MCH8518008.1 RHS repeat-associated core domain-containing protein [Cyclobacteriaceae bacterium]
MCHYYSSRLGIARAKAETGKLKLGHRNYELSNHLDNVLSVITDNVNMSNEESDWYDSQAWPTVLIANDYYPFGPQMSGRQLDNEGYRYGFNGKEEDPEGLGGGGSTYEYGFRIYNPQISKFLSVDPLADQAPGWTPYRFGFNNPIRFLDPNGLFETESDTKQWAKDNKIRTGWFSRHKVEQESGGSWAVNNRKEGASYFRASSLDGLDVVGRRDDGVIKSALVLAQPYIEVTATASEIWNSPIARSYVPDKISLSFSSSVTAFAGTNTDFSLNWITRGHDAQFSPYAVMTVGGQVGTKVMGDALINFSTGFYATTDMRTLPKGKASRDLLGWSTYGGAGAGAGLGGSVFGSIGFEKGPLVSSPTWVSGGVGIGPSIGIGATGGVSYSWPIIPGQFKR